jgi:hypothetical protein
MSGGNPLGGVIGGLAGGAIGWWGNENAREQQIAAITHQINEQFGSLTAASRIAQQYGLTLDSAFATDPTHLQQALDLLVVSTQKAQRGWQNLQEGLGTARTSAQNLITAIDEGVSDALRDTFQNLIDLVDDALLRTGQGVLDARLEQSQAFQRAQGLAGDVRGVVAGMSQASYFTAAVMAAASQASGQLQAEAAQAALDAGMSQTEATQAGFGAIAPLLQAQVDAAIYSNQEQSTQLQALLAEARANGLEIVASPLAQQLEVQRESAAYLNQIYGVLSGAHSNAPYGMPAGQPLPAGSPAIPQGGGPPSNYDYGPRPKDYPANLPWPPVQAAGGMDLAVMPDLGGGLGPLIQTHANEEVLVIPASKRGRTRVIHAMQGLQGEDGGGGGGWDGGGGGGGAGEGGGPIEPPRAFEQMAVELAAAVTERLTQLRPISVNYSVSPTINEDPTASREKREDLRKFTGDVFRNLLRERDPELMYELRRVLGEA